MAIQRGDLMHGRLVALAAGSLLIAFCVWLLLPQHRINASCYEQIQPGMTREHVEAILGVPPGVYTPSSTYFEGSDVFPRGKVPVEICQLIVQVTSPSSVTWYGDEAFITISFGPDGRVTQTDMVTVHGPTFLESLRFKLGRAGSKALFWLD